MVRLLRLATRRLLSAQSTFMEPRTAYLSKAEDHADLERRMGHWEQYCRRPPLPPT